MPLKIRSKLTTAFICLILFTLLITGGIYCYVQLKINRSMAIYTDISREMHAVHSLQLRFKSAMMPGNDYIITGNKRYMKEFDKASADMEGLFKNLEGILERSLHGVSDRRAEIKILRDVKTSWDNIKDITNKIFSIPEPAGSREAAFLMEEMDYRWGYPAVEKLRQWNDLRSSLHEEIREDIERTQRKAWIIMGVGTIVLFAVGVLFSILYSRFFVGPIKMLHQGAGAIAGGDYESRLDIKTGDEMEELANAMNDMAARLQIAHSSLESQVEVRTEELQAANEEMMASNEELQAAYSQLEAATAELEEANEDLSRANNESQELDELKLRFLQTVSHELRSPLTPILGYLEMMRDGDIGSLSPKQNEVVEEIYLCGKNMQMVVEELLEVASIQAGKLSLEFEDVDLQPILWQAVKGIRKYADGNNIKIDTRFSPDPIWVVGDKLSLAKIFTHLVRNAVKFNRENGSVAIEARTSDNGVEVIVSDTGIGIPPDKLDRIYEAFYQVESSSARHYDGVGLGLYLVKRLVDIHNGKITVKSDDSAGTSFSIFLPRKL